MAARPATADDLDAVVDTVALAFAHDPVWEVALARPDGALDHIPAFWRFFVDGAMRHGTVWVSGEADAVSVWLPDGEPEMSEDQAEALRRHLDASLPASRVADLLTLWSRFEEHRALRPAHAYLNLLATHPRAAGRGLGMAHLAADLERWDAQGMPTYLESSNPANNARYARHGYVEVGRFPTVINQSPVTLMWRPVGG
ncbi:GNAT family N-acetyltransferase [Demequina maris]|uniref:GNAT family N-acetyltransferase n=1 Tax=Demequina maris TaxID=1638982 RepID=UPI000784B6D0|nr:hypothetical protein [Demequina maris]